MGITTGSMSHLARPFCRVKLVLELRGKATNGRMVMHLAALVGENVGILLK